jgi:ABC-type glycerol-3-phosphate transport system permease component
MLAAYAFVFFQFPLKRLLFWAILILMMLPGILVLVPLFVVTRNLGLMNSYAGLILPQVAGNLVIAIFLFHAYLEDFPRPLIEAARIEGASEWAVLWRVVLPLCTPVASTVVIVTVLSTWNNYAWPLLVVRDEALRTIPLGLGFIQTEYDLQHNTSVLMACYAVASVPLLACFLVFLRPFLEGLSAGAVKE